MRDIVSNSLFSRAPFLLRVCLLFFHSFFSHSLTRCISIFLFFHTNSLHLVFFSILFHSVSLSLVFRWLMMLMIILTTEYIYQPVYLNNRKNLLHVIIITPHSPLWSVCILFHRHPHAHIWKSYKWKTETKRRNAQNVCTSHKYITSLHYFQTICMYATALSEQQKNYREKKMRWIVKKIEKKYM